jgi:FKBP-type peptidyl-prolyl cis-trans isomerase FkpA
MVKKTDRSRSTSQINLGLIPQPALSCAPKGRLMHKTATMVMLGVLATARWASAQAPKAEGQAKPESAKKKDGGSTDKAAAGKGTVKTSSGLVYTELKAGNGPSPKATDTVKVHYRGTLTDGKEFDSSYKRGQPAEFPLNRVIPCWTEGVQMMKVGGKAKLECPSSIAYGPQGHPPVIPGGATLIFEIELLGINPK